MKRRWVLALGLAVGAALGPPGAGAQQTAPGPTRAAVDRLLGRGRPQEAAWMAREAGDTARAAVILARLDSILRSPPTAVAPLGVDSQGVSYTFRLRHGDAAASIFKVDGSDIFCAACGADREVAAYRIDRLLGIDLTPVTVPQRVVHDGDTLTGSAMYYIDEARKPIDVGRSKPDRLRFFDAVIGNTDRHDGNWLVSPDGRAVAIDHNRAFEYASSTRARTCWETEVDSIGRPAELGSPYARYRTLPADSLAAAVSGVLSPDLVARFVAMRERVVARIESRIRAPDTPPPLHDCASKSSPEPSPAG